MQEATEENRKGGAVESPRPTGLSHREGKKVSLIDSDLANAALQLRAMAEAIEPGFNPEQWLQERGL